MATSIAYRTDQTLPALALCWRDRDGQVIDFASGWTFTVKLADAAAPAVVVRTKTAGIVGGSTLPNVTIDFEPADWTGLPHSTTGRPVTVHIEARRAIDGKIRAFRPDSPLVVRLMTAPSS